MLKPLISLSFVTGTAGLEPAARCLEGSYSIQLSYAPNSKIANNIILSVQCAIEQVNYVLTLKRSEHTLDS